MGDAAPTSCELGGYLHKTTPGEECFCGAYRQLHGPPKPGEQMAKGRWRAEFSVTAPCPSGFWTADEPGGPGGCEVETRQDCDDLIELLRVVRERLP